MQVTKLTWADLLIQEAEPTELSACLAAWAFLLSGQVSPIFLNRFGSWFLRRPDDSVDMLDVLGGAVTRVAPTFEAFSSRVNTVDWQEEHLLSRQVFTLHEAGVVASGSQCYGVPHPGHGFPDPRVEGGLKLDFVRLTSLVVWQSLCRQALGGPP